MGRRFYRWMAVPVGLAATIQALYLWQVHATAYHNGDAAYYNVQAELITRGYWFVNPYDYSWAGKVVPSASHPPLTTLVLAGADELGLRSWTDHMAVMAVLFVATVFIAGLIGRMLGGDRTGVVVALVVASSPYLWVNPGAVLSESVEVLVVALALWAAYRVRRDGGWWRAAELGLYLGLATLTRSELILMVPLIGIPVLVAPRLRWRPLLSASVAFVVVVGPWVGRNMTAFHHREYLSTEGGVTLATANCAGTYYGADIGWWLMSCDTAKVGPTADESDVDRAERKEGEAYIKAHPGRFVVVAAVRVLRVWNLYRPIQQAHFDTSDARPVGVSEAGMVVFYGLVPLSVVGAVALRRRGVACYPLVALLVIVTVASALFFANGRYRTEGDLALAILGGVGVDALINRARSRRRSPAPASEGAPALVTDAGSHAG